MVSEHLGPGADGGRPLAVIHPPGLGHEGFFTLPCGPARGVILDRRRLPLTRTTHQGVGKRRDRMAEAALVRDPLERIIQGARKP